MRTQIIRGVLVAVCVLLASAARSELIQSNGLGGAPKDWDAAATWEGGVSPAPDDDVIIRLGDHVVIDSTITRNASTVIEVNSGINRGRLSIGLDTNQQNAAGELINLGGINVGGRLDVFPLGTLSNSGTVTITAPETFTSGLNIYGTFENDPSGVLSIDRCSTCPIDGRLNNQGTISVVGSAGIAVLQVFLGTLTSSGSLSVTGTSSFLQMESDGGKLVNYGAISSTSGGRIEISKGSFLNENGATLNCASGTLTEIGDSGSGRVQNDATWISNGTTTVGSAGSLLNSSCGHLTNNGGVTNNGFVLNCGLIDGSAGITGAGILDSTSCGANTPDATLEVQVTDSGSGDPVSNARVFLERVCLPIGTRMPFFDVADGSANYFLEAVEPAQYEIKAFAPGYAPFSGRVILVQSGEVRVEDVALFPDPNAVNTLRVDLTVDGPSRSDPGGALVTDNFQVTQNGGEPFAPTVTIDGTTMDLVGLGYGVTQADALVEGFAVATANVNFVPSGPRTLEFNGSASLTGELGFPVITIVFAEPPPEPLAGFKVHFKRKIDGEAAPVEGQIITGAAEVFTVICPNPTPNTPEFCPSKISATEFSKNFIIGAGDYYVVVSNERDTITSNVVDQTIAPIVTTPVPQLFLDLSDDDTDGDTLPDEWEDNNDLDPDSAAPPNGASDDPDSDLLTNSEEYARKFSTDPNLSDTDADGYSDGFEHYAGSDPTDIDPDVPNTPQPRTQVYVLKNSAAPLQVGTYDFPVTTFSAAKNTVANGGTIFIRNPGSTIIAFPGAVTLGNGNKPMTLRLDNPTGPRVRIGAAN